MGFLDPSTEQALVKVAAYALLGLCAVFFVLCLREVRDIFRMK